MEVFCKHNKNPYPPVAPPGKGRRRKFYLITKEPLLSTMEEKSQNYCLLGDCLLEWNTQFFFSHSWKRLAAKQTYPVCFVVTTPWPSLDSIKKMKRIKKSLSTDLDLVHEERSDTAEVAHNHENWEPEMFSVLPLSIVSAMQVMG